MDALFALLFARQVLQRTWCARYGELSQEFNVKVAETPEEVEKLLAVGFEYVCEKDDRLFFRKRK